MQYIVRLSKEHDDLPIAEFEAVMRAEGITYDITDRKDNLVFFETADDIAGLDRLAMSYEVGAVLARFDPQDPQLDAAPAATESFAVRKTVLDETSYASGLESALGGSIDAVSETAVDLEAPQEIFRAYLCDGQGWLTREAVQVDRSGFEARHNEYRPFSQPVVMHPRLARTLVNLSEVPRDGSVLDPFCGTGGILIEADLVGCDVSGLDIQDHMVAGAKQNLAAFGCSGDVRLGDVADLGEIFDTRFDVIVTDLPYGRGSKLEGAPIEAFLREAPGRTDGRIVFMSNDDTVGGHDPDFEVYVHRSMTRYIYVLE